MTDELHEIPALQWAYAALCFAEDRSPMAEWFTRAKPFVARLLDEAIARDTATDRPDWVGQVAGTTDPDSVAPTNCENCQIDMPREREDPLCETCRKGFEDDKATDARSSSFREPLTTEDK